TTETGIRRPSRTVSCVSSLRLSCVFAVWCRCCVTGRKRDAEDGSSGRTAFDGDLTTVHLDRPSGDGQPETGAAVIAGPGFVEAKEAIEDSFAVFRMDSRPFVGNGQNRVRGIGLHAKIDGRRPRTVLDRVVDDVGDRLAQHQT